MMIERPDAAAVPLSAAATGVDASVLVDALDVCLVSSEQRAREREPLVARAARKAGCDLGKGVATLAQLSWGEEGKPWSA